MFPTVHPAVKKQDARINSALILAQSREIVKEEYIKMCQFLYFVVKVHKMGNK